MTNQSRKGAHLKKKLQHNAVYLLHKVVKMLHTGFCLCNKLIKIDI